MDTREAWKSFLNGQTFEARTEKVYREIYIPEMLEEYRGAYSLLVNHPDAKANFILGEMDHKELTGGSHTAPTKKTRKHWKALRDGDHIPTRELNAMLAEIEDAELYLLNHPYASALDRVVALDRNNIMSYLKTRERRA